MRTNSWIFVGCVLMLVVFTICQGKTRHLDDDDADDSDDLEISQARARAFLDSDSDESLVKRVQNGDCVLCKLNTFPCCKPNFCKKKRFRPDECVEVKGK